MINLFGPSVLYRVSYGLATPGRSAPFITNLAGLIFQCSYCIIFLRCSHGDANNRVRKSISLSVGASIIVISIGIVLPKIGVQDFLLKVRVQTDNNPWQNTQEVMSFICVPQDQFTTTDLLGLAGCVLNTAAYGSPLLIVGQVIK